MKRLYLALILAGCATAGTEERAGVQPDANGGGGGGGGGGIDASVQPVDAAPHPDSGSGSGTCTTVTQNLLTNGNFDGTPLGTGWTETPAVATDKIVSPDGTIAEQTAPNKAWLGGVLASNATTPATDVLYQDVNIPPSATAVVLNGYYDVRTAETGTTVYDTAKLEIVTTGGTLIASALSLDNAHAKTAWTTFSYPVTANVANQTIRIRATAKNDNVSTTSFYFDTLTLQVTYCQ